MHFFQRNHQLIEEARLPGKGYKLWLELLIFIAVFASGIILQSAALTGAMIFSFFISPDGISAVLSGGSADVAAITAAIENGLPGGMTLWSLFTTVLTTAACLVYCLAIEKRKARTMGFVKKHAGIEYIKGLLIGLVMFSAVVLGGTLCGVFRFQGLSQTLSPGLLTAYFFGFLLQGMSEEVLCRGYLMISAARKNSLPAAVLANSLIFALLHLANNGLTLLAAINLFLFGFFASVFTLKRGNIWCISAIHAVWNFAQGNLYGLSVSGIEKSPSLFVFEQTGNALLDGGAFGPEGGLLVTAVLAAAIVLVIFLPEKKKADATTVSNPESKK